jgi:hypothetical protein
MRSWLICKLEALWQQGGLFILLPVEIIESCCLDIRDLCNSSEPDLDELFTHSTGQEYA